MMSLAEALSMRRSCREFDDRPVPLAALQRILWAAQGATGGDGKRTVPSAHSVYPLRLHVVAGEVEGLASGIHAVHPERCPEMAVTSRDDVRPRLQAVALDDQPWIGRAPCIITISADMALAAAAFVEQPPFGLRGIRYAHIEAGAAAQAIQLQAVAEGIGSVLVAGFRDEATGAALHLNPPMAPLALMCLGWPKE